MTHVTVAVGLVASLLGAPAPASATQSILSATAIATATCGAGEVVIAGGGEVDYGPGVGGGVALTGITPADDGHSITVTAAAPPGRAANWSLIAHVKCKEAQPPVRVVEHGIGTVIAECPAPAPRLFGLGFRVEGGLVTEVGMDAALSRVRVTAGDSVEVTAIALCKRPAEQMQRVRRVSTAEGWPKIASGEDNDPDLEVYAVGATVVGPPGATLDAIVPGADGGTCWARGTVIGAGAQQRSASDDEDEGVLMEAAAIGTFH